jgi:sec-independent protein translocase protein TatA
MPGWVSPWELIILVLVILLVFGAKRLPEMGRSLGGGMREFKDSITGKDEVKPEELPPAAAPTRPTATTRSSHDQDAI